MDASRLDAIARQIGAPRTRRGAARAILGLTLGLVAPQLMRPAPDAAARRQACQVRCGADRRFCKAECRRTGAFARQCKRDCRVWRDQCFQRCQFKPLTRRLAR